MQLWYLRVYRYAVRVARKDVEVGVLCTKPKGPRLVGVMSSQVANEGTGWG
jgi:hypothetical protein